jgi:hypothetical protein
MAHKFNHGVEMNKIKAEKNKFADRFDEEMKKYPMLKVCSNIWDDKHRKTVAEYIDTIEIGTQAQSVLNCM